MDDVIFIRTVLCIWKVNIPSFFFQSLPFPSFSLSLSLQIYSIIDFTRTWERRGALGEVRRGKHRRMKGRAVKVKGRWGYRSRKIKATNKRDAMLRTTRVQGAGVRESKVECGEDRGLKAKRKRRTRSYR